MNCPLEDIFDLSIIIVNWNTRNLLAQCLESVRENIETFDLRRPVDERLNVETFVVDNASTDGSAVMVRQRFPWVRLIENSENVGFAAANNLALRQAQGKHLLLLNPDTQVYPGALMALVDFVNRFPRAGAAGACLLNSDGDLQLSCHPVPTLFREAWRLFHLDYLYPISEYPMHTWDTVQPRQVETAQGACLLLRREALEQVGLLDEGYFIYTEEVDLCYRLIRSGWQVWWVPQARVLHYGGQSTRQLFTEMFLQLYKSKVCFFRKHYGPLSVWCYKGLLTLAALVRVAVGWACGWLHDQLAADKAHLYSRLLKAIPSM